MGRMNYLLQVLLVHLVGLYWDVSSGYVFPVTLTYSDPVFKLVPQYQPAIAAFQTDITWEVKGPPGSRLILHCPFIFIPERADCLEGFLSIRDSGNEVKICKPDETYLGESIGDTMTVQFKNGPGRMARITCVIRLKTRDDAGPSRPSSSEIAGFSSTSFEVAGPSRSASGVLDTGDYADVIAQDDGKTSCPCSWTNRRRIVGGRQTEAHEFIFMAYIRYSWSITPSCGGSILTQRHVLTAAHCLKEWRKESLQVVLGGHDYRTTEIGKGVTQILGVLNMYSHKDWTDETKTHDIGLLVLDRDIQYTPLVGPVCFPTEQYQLHHRHVTAIGWGVDRMNGSTSPILQSVSLKVVGLDVCSKSFKSTPISLKTPTQICISGRGKDTGEGDSGGPLVYLDPTINRYVQVGVISYGAPLVSQTPMTPSVNADVFSYVDWIQDRIRQFSPPCHTCQKR